MIVCYIGLGSNLGDRQGYIDRAMRELKKTAGITVKRNSAIYETDPVSDIPQGKFLNGVAEIETTLGAQALLQILKGIEQKLCRETLIKDAPRTIDLDILYYGDQKIDSLSLTVPHPRIGEREFVQRGLRELGKA